MQHSSLEPRSNPGGEVRQVKIAPLIPARSQATEFAWSSAEARRRLVHGFDSRNASSRTFNLIRSKLVAMQRERGWRMLGIVSATPNVGKSFVSANVAAAMSRDPRFQTYLIDLDLRRGTIREMAPLFAVAGSVIIGFPPFERAAPRRKSTLRCCIGQPCTGALCERQHGTLEQNTLSGTASSRPSATEKRRMT